LLAKRTKPAIRPTTLLKSIGRPKPILEGNPSMMLHLGGSPSLPHNRVHLDINKLVELKLVGRHCGILAIICELPNNVILYILLQMHIVNDQIELDATR
jgi:hypothetical protein